MASSTSIPSARPPTGSSPPSNPDGCTGCLLPRHDKQLAEQAYFLDGRPLSETQATLLLQRMGLALDPLLEQSDAVLSQLIERYQKNR